MTLQSELDAFRAGWESRVGEAIAGLISGDIEDLRKTGILDRAAKAGDALPAAGDLLDQHGKRFDLAALVADKPVIITFYRGGWCPYCNLELRGYQALLSEIEAAGGALVAVTPELPDHSLSTAEKNDLSFTVLSDLGGALASALGIRFTLSDKVRPFYEKAGHALPDRNGDGTWALPMPATFVVAKGGRIAAAFVEPDYRKRLDPKDALAALRSLRPALAA
jgi:peroxiredoxin